MKDLGSGKTSTALEAPGAFAAAFAAAIVVAGLTFANGCNKHEKPVLSPSFNPAQDASRINQAPTIIADGPAIK